MAFYGNSYSYEAEREKEVVRDGCDSYSAGYNRYDAECDNSGYPMGHRRHNMVSEVACESNVIRDSGRHHLHGGASQIVEKEERIIYENSNYDPCRRMC